MLKLRASFTSKLPSWPKTPASILGKLYKWTRKPRIAVATSFVSPVVDFEFFASCLRMSSCTVEPSGKTPRRRHSAQEPNHQKRWCVHYFRPVEDVISLHQMQSDALNETPEPRHLGDPSDRRVFAIPHKRSSAPHRRRCVCRLKNSQPR